MTRSPFFTSLLSRYGVFLGLATFFVSAESTKAQPVRGLYVAGSAGASFNQAQKVNPHTTLFATGRDNFATGITGLGSIGWGLGNGFRVEIEGNYRNNRYSNFSTTFPTQTHGHQQAYGAMANALFDMDIGQNWIYPYFGAGIGYGRQHMNADFVARDYHYGEHIGGTSGNFAYQAMFGLSLPVPGVVGLSTTMEYRFYSIVGHHNHNSQAVNMSDTQVTETEGTRSTRTDFNHSLMLGLRYEFNPAPPPPPPASTLPNATPAPTAARTYLVFFDWNSSHLSDKARMIISEAVRNATSAQVTHIEVNGHTDMSGETTKSGHHYNQELSLKRAQAVKVELVRDGIAEGLIHINALGASQPLIVTAPNVREAHNRRVEIDLK